MKNLVGDEYDILDEYINAHTKILMKHNECEKEFLITPSSFLKGTRCSFCQESKGEKAISITLNKFGITYEPQYKFDDCRNKLPLPFDFAIFDNNGKLLFLMEYQGKQHYDPYVKHFGYIKGYRKRRRNDHIKKMYCEDKNIKLVEIPYWEFDNIEKILKNELLGVENNYG